MFANGIQAVFEFTDALGLDIVATQLVWLSNSATCASRSEYTSMAQHIPHRLVLSSSLGFIGVVLRRCLIECRLGRLFHFRFPIQHQDCGVYLGLS